SYRAPAAPKPGKPRSLRIVRRGSRLVVSWRPNPGGFRHAVHITLGDGRSLVREVSARRRSVTLKGVSSRVGAKVKVVGLTRANAKGPSARASIKARR
ncbi:MAG: hypothetical protein M3340_19325, partial [Actinomycetota bacterium]|nr:hypothetical protein [Actinomycetota bacterium]